jgi:peptidoglycan lytic transglycosylase G
MFSKLLGIAVISVSFALAWLMLDIQQFAEVPLNVPESGIDYTLEPGTTLGNLAKDLENKGYISNSVYLRIIARWTGQGKAIKAGEYRIQSGTNPTQLLEQLVSGQVNTYNITLVEGWNFRQMLSAINSNQMLSHTLEGLSDAQIMSRLGHDGMHPEGRFLADTYNFPKGTTDLALLQRTFAAMQTLLHKEWEKRDPSVPLTAPYQALILASIVEKETALPEERREIAGVFVRRLKKHMRLQTDPTVIYGMGDKYKGNIRRKDLKTDTPYNTYMHGGLTPTPICMPGKDAIRAVMHPAPGNTIYFVAKNRGDGSHHFSKTLKEHNEAVRKYQLKR